MKKIFIPLLILAAAVPAAAKSACPDSMMMRVTEACTKNSFAAAGKTSVRYRERLVVSDIKMYHKKPNKCRIEYCTPPLKGLVVGSDGRCAWRFDPGLRKVVVQPRESTGCMDRDTGMRLLLDNHCVEAAGDRIVAGRPARVLVVKSRSGEIRKRLCVDASTCVTLRSEDYDDRGTMRSSTEFKSIRYTDDLPDSLFACPKNAAPIVTRPSGKTMSLPDLSKALGFQVKVPQYVPRGYKLDGYRLYPCPCRHGHKSAYIRYTNGLNSISVFETKGDSCCARMMVRGSCESCSLDADNREHMATRSVGGKLLVTVGDVRPSELDKIVNSIH